MSELNFFGKLFIHIVSAEISVMICENFYVVFSQVTGWRTFAAIIRLMALLAPRTAPKGKNQTVFLLIPKKHLHDCCC